MIWFWRQLTCCGCVWLTTVGCGGHSGAGDSRASGGGTVLMSGCHSAHTVSQLCFIVMSQCWWDIPVPMSGCECVTMECCCTLHSDTSEGETTASFVYSSCPFIKRRRVVQRVIFSDDITEHYYDTTETPPADSDNTEYEDPITYLPWPENRHFFSLRVWRAIRR